MSFLNRLLNQSSKKSSNVAKQRLQVVLVQDRVKLSPHVMNLLRGDIISAISKYVEIDINATDITVAKSARQNFLVANIPIVAAKSDIQ